jgi:hypothetical protein
VYAPGQPCPFRGDPYQLMRNISFAYKWACDRQLPDFAFLVMLVDSAPASSKMRSAVEEFRGLLLPGHRGRLGVISHERLADVVELQHREKPLAHWIRQRITQVCGGEAGPCQTNPASARPSS